MTTAALRSPPRLENPNGSLIALARFEAQALLLHRLVWFGGLVSVALAVWEIRQEAPVLNRVSMILAWTMLPLAAAAALGCGWAVLRSRGRTDADPPLIMPMGIDRRVAGIVLGLAGPALIALGIQLGLLLWVFTRDPVTSLVWSELLHGPLLVAFAGAVSAVLARWFPHPSTPLLAVFVVAGTILVPYSQEDWGYRLGFEWLSPLAWPQGIIPYEVAFRPAGLHLGYLAFLVVFVGAIASLGRGIKSWLVAGTGLVIAATLGMAQLGPISESERSIAIDRLVGDDADLTCETHLGVEFCAMPGYSGWIDDWVDLARPIIEAAPVEAAIGVQVRQYPVQYALLDYGGSTGWWWAEISLRDVAERQAVLVGSARFVGFQPEARSIAWGLVGCRPFECHGEAQAVAFLWLVVHDPGVQSYTVLDPDWGVAYGNVTDCMVRDLWGLPGTQQLIHQHWKVLTDSETTYQEAAELLGVSIPTGYDENGNLPEGCP